MNVPTDGVDEPRDRSQTIVAYLKGEMNETEAARFEQQMTEDETLQEEIETSRNVLDSLAASSAPPILERTNEIISSGVAHRASDIHLIPDAKAVRVLYRIDGVLTQIAEQDRLPAHLLQPIIDRFKVMCDMNLGERRVTQDGRLPLTIQGRRFDLRVSIVPALHGECLTARILPADNILIGLDRLGYSTEQVAALRRLCRSRSGLVLAGGWAGSGRSTLLYSLLKETQVLFPQRKIVTVEDPVELDLSTDTSPVTQISVNARSGMTFAAGLHSALRQDPDIVYCGEMETAEMAELGAKTATRGVLLFGALSATSALGIISRLRNKGIPDYLIADNLAGLIGVRLVRRVDQRQTESYQPQPEELKRAGIADHAGAFVRGVPTPENHQTGFAGRVPLIEIVEITPALRRLIAGGADIAAMHQAAFVGGGTLRDDARAKVTAGVITVEEANWALFDYHA